MHAVLFEATQVCIVEGATNLYFFSEHEISFCHFSVRDVPRVDPPVVEDTVVSVG